MVGGGRERCRRSTPGAVQAAEEGVQAAGALHRERRRHPVATTGI